MKIFKKILGYIMLLHIIPGFVFISTIGTNITFMTAYLIGLGIEGVALVFIGVILLAYYLINE